MTFSGVFPSYHPRRHNKTNFVEKIHYSIWNNVSDEYIDMIDFIRSANKHLPPNLVNHYIYTLDMETRFEPKHHTIRAGHRWKVGDKFSPRVWSGQPYKSKQIIIAPDIEVKKVWTFDVVKDGDYVMAAIDRWPFYEENKDFVTNVEGFETLSKNDGLSVPDLKAWFKWPKPTGEMQIICWNESINY